MAFLILYVKFKFTAICRNHGCLYGLVLMLGPGSNGKLQIEIISGFKFYISFKFTNLLDSSVLCYVNNFDNPLL